VEPLPPSPPPSKQQCKASTRAKNAPCRVIFTTICPTPGYQRMCCCRVIVESICWRVCVNWREQQKHPLLRGEGVEGGGGVGRAPLASPRTLRAPGGLSDDRISYQKPSIQLIYTRENWLLLVLSYDIKIFSFLQMLIFLFPYCPNVFSSIFHLFS
jgi:hypothetical protein